MGQIVPNDERRARWMVHGARTILETYRSSVRANHMLFWESQRRSPRPYGRTSGTRPYGINSPTSQSRSYQGLLSFGRVMTGSIRKMKIRTSKFRKSGGGMQ